MMIQETGKSIVIKLILILKLSLNTLGFIARDMSTKKQITNITIAVNESIVSFETFLGRYDINASYYMSG